nr:hypothetical protein [Lachnospiraceae bacterium]
MKKFNVLRLWIIAEVAIIFILIIAVLVKTVFADTKDDGPTYVVPSVTETAGISVNDIDLPADLYAKDSEEENAENITSEIEYPEEITEKLAGMSTEQKVSMLFIISPETLCNM